MCGYQRCCEGCDLESIGCSDMAPKEKPSKKNQQKAQARVIEDRTFGLKNKNKSSKVQSYIKQVEVGIKNSNGAIDAVSA